MRFNQSKIELPCLADVLPGRKTAISTPERHFVNGHPIVPPFPTGLEQALFGLGCFWGGERLFWKQDGVFCTAVGYSGGITPNPTYRELCGGRTGHSEVVMVVFDPVAIAYEVLLHLFWTSHDPTQGMRQGNDVGSQYRSAIYTYSPRQAELAIASKATYQEGLSGAGYGPITTEIAPVSQFYYAENEHQQYLAKNPGGYCGLGGTGVVF